MKAIYRVALFGVCFITLAVLPFSAGGSPSESNQDRWEWVQKCLRDFEKLKVGMTRKQVEGKFQMDSGLQSLVSPNRYTHPDCPYFKIDVEYNFHRNPADQNRPMKSKDDKVVRVSKPYLGYLVQD